MEPIVLMGLMIVAYGGYVALQDFLEDVSIRFPRKLARGSACRRKLVCDLKPPIKKMAGMHV